ncbi:unnamed protein product [Blepharisma stoltei]|uniref:RTR1-type domain-containing protein n=1 Tax=Blepharisma stoltei TaxID=1481888 RepID=A0AAU9IEN6_9CILI|nr:unnamed protein product [Blepharisma stoltei]
MAEVIKGICDIKSVSNLFTTEAYKRIKAKDYKLSINCLEICESMFYTLENQGQVLDYDLIIAILHNLSLCYHKLNIIDKCITCLETCYFRANSLMFNNQKCSMLEEQMVKDKYLSSLCLQFSNLLSKENRHNEALVKAKLAYKHSVTLINNTAIAAKKQLVKSVEGKLPQSKTAMIQRAFPALSAISNFLEKGDLQEVIEIRSSVGVLGHPQWIIDYSLSEVIDISACPLEVFSVRFGIQSEFTKDYLLYKVILIGLSLFCIGKELCYVRSFFDGYNICVKAYNFLKKFLPEEAVLLKDLSKIVTELKSKNQVSEEISLSKKLQRVNSNVSRSISTSRRRSIKSSFSANILQSVSELRTPSLCGGFESLLRESESLDSMNRVVVLSSHKRCKRSFSKANLFI